MIRDGIYINHEKSLHSNFKINNRNNFISIKLKIIVQVGIFPFKPMILIHPKNTQQKSIKLQAESQAYRKHSTSPFVDLFNSIFSIAQSRTWMLNKCGLTDTWGVKICKRTTHPDLVIRNGFLEDAVFKLGIRVSTSEE